jgi:hypothetical protein
MTITKYEISSDDRPGTIMVSQIEPGSSFVYCGRLSTRLVLDPVLTSNVRAFDHGTRRIVELGNGTYVYPAHVTITHRPAEV